MNSRSKYKTKQREILIRYLESVPGVHITAGDVADYFRKQGSAIGQSTIYRQLESLVDEGIINKYVIDGNSPTCFHCKCEKCGKLIHLHCDELEEIQEHLYAEHRFRMDPLRTVFYGLCDECLQN